MKRAFTLLEVLFAIGLTSVSLLLAMQLFESRAGHVQKLHNNVAQLTLQRYVTENIDCKNTLYPGGANCAADTWLTAHNLAGGIMATGDLGSVPVGSEWALRVKCQQAPAAHLLVEYGKRVGGAVASWSNLFDGIPVSCPNDSPAPLVCAVTDVSDSFNDAQIASALGLPANAWLVQDRFHAHLICRKLGYSVATSHGSQSTSPCGGHTINAWSKVNNGWASESACDATLRMRTVTCRYKETGTCPCPQQKYLGPNNQSPSSLVASHFPNVQFRGSFGFNCFAFPGNVITGSSSKCPAIYAGDASTPKKVCEIFGYAKVSSMAKTSYSSCSNNSVAKWNSATNTFDVTAACAFNQLIQNITCSDPIAGQCDSFY